MSIMAGSLRARKKRIRFCLTLRRDPVYLILINMFEFEFAIISGEIIRISEVGFGCFL